MYANYIRYPNTVTVLKGSFCLNVVNYLMIEKVTQETLVYQFSKLQLDES